MMQNDASSMIWQCVKSKGNLKRACDYFHKFLSNRLPGKITLYSVVGELYRAVASGE